MTATIGTESTATDDRSRLGGMAGGLRNRIAALVAGKSWMLAPLVAFAVTRLMVFIAGYLAEVAFVGNVGPDFWHVRPGNLLLDLWARFDSGFYIGIVEQGYWFDPSGGMSNVAFFPVYPLLVNLTAIVARDTVLAAAIVSNLCLLGALLYLYKLTELEFGDAGTAQRAVFYIAAFPTAFFFSAIYTESAFLLFSVATMYYARRHLWLYAGLMGMITSATRIVGVVMAGIVALEWMRVQGWTISTCYRRTAWQNLGQGLRTDWRSLLPIALIPLGILSYMLFLQVRFDDPIAFWTVQAAWNRENVGPLVIIWQAISGLAQQNFLAGIAWWQVLIDLVVLCSALIIAIPTWRRLGEHYALLILIGMLVPAASSIMSLSRYVLVLFPIFMMLAWWGRRPLLDRSILIGFATLLGLFTAIVVKWIFVA